MREADDDLLFPATNVRYCARPFPAYRHIPGTTPHPLTDREGHSFAGAGSAGLPSGAIQAKSDTGVNFCYGADLYNAGYWWEAHEAWEAVWLATPPNSAERHGLRGMIQVANCHLKVHMGRRNAAIRLQSDFERCFQAALLHVPGLMIHRFAFAPWVQQVRDYYAVIGTRAGHDLVFYPYIVIRAPD